MSEERDELTEALRTGLEELPVRELRAAEFDARVLAMARAGRPRWVVWTGPRLAAALSLAVAAIVLLVVAVAYQRTVSATMFPVGGTPIENAQQAPRDWIDRVGGWLMGIPDNRRGAPGDRQTGNLGGISPGR